MVIVSFWSGLDMEDVSPANLEKFRGFREYARAKGLDLGGYSLLASRTIDAETDVIDPKTGKPGGAIFGHSPCLGSRWGAGLLRADPPLHRGHRLQRLRARRQLPRRRVRLDQPPRPPRPLRLAVDAVPADRGALPLVPRARRLPERARLLLPRRLEQDGHGLPRDELVAAARRAARARAPEPVRRHLGEDAEHGLDDGAARRVPGRRRGGDARAAAGAPAATTSSTSRTTSATEHRRATAARACSTVPRRRRSC